MAIEYLSDKKCRLVLYMGSNKDGKPIRKTKTVSYTSKRDAERQYRHFAESVERGELELASNMTVEQMCNKALDSYKRLKKTTYSTYTKALEVACKVLGEKVADKVTSYDIEMYVSYLEEHYSKSTIRVYFRILSITFNKAVRWRWITYNPCLEITLPTSNDSRAMLPLEYMQPYCKAVSDNADMNTQVAFELALFCGLRISEILGLTIDNVNAEDGYISIVQSRHHVSGEDYVSSPKSDSSVRDLAVPVIVMEHIKALVVSNKTGFLIQNGFGEPLSATTIRNRMYRIEKANHLPHVTLHGLRHTYASLLIRQGNDILEVSQQMGHANKSVTLNVYAHMFESKKEVSKRIADDINKLIHT